MYNVEYSLNKYSLRRVCAMRASISEDSAVYGTEPLRAGLLVSTFHGSA